MKESVNILYLGFFGFPDHDASANRVMNNAKLLRSSGHEVYLLDEQVNYEWEGLLQSRRVIDDFIVYSQKRPTTKKQFVNKMISIDNVKVVVDDIGGVNAIIAYNYPSIALNKLYRYYKGEIAIISDCTEWYSGKEYKFPLSILSAMDSLFRMRIVNKRLNGIICISSFLYDYYGHSNNSFLLPPLIDHSAEIWNQENLRYNNNVVNLIYGGSPGRDKEKMSPIIRAICESSNKNKIVLRIVGMTKEQYLDTYPEDRDIVEKNNSSLRFFGRIPHDEYIQMLISSDVLVFIRNKTRVTMAGFSTKFVEAVSAGVSVITTDTSDMGHYIRKYNCGYIIDESDELKDLFNSEELFNIKDRAHEYRDIFDYRNYAEVCSWIEHLVSM